MMERAAERSAELADELGAMAQRASVASEAYVRENPWTVVGGATALGLLLGALFTHSVGSGRDDSHDD